MAETKANSLDKPKLSQDIFVLFCLVNSVSGLHPNVNGLPFHFSLCLAVLFQSSLLLSFSLLLILFYFMFVFNAIFILCDVAVVSEDLT